MSSIAATSLLAVGTDSPPSLEKSGTRWNGGGTGPYHFKAAAWNTANASIPPSAAHHLRIHFADGGAEDVAACFKSDGTGALVTASRSVIYAYENSKYLELYASEWEKCVEQAALDMKQDVRQVLELHLHAVRLVVLEVLGRGARMQRVHPLFNVHGNFRRGGSEGL